MIETINYDAISTYYKLNNRSAYKAAWQAFTMIVDKMFTQDFKTYYYAMYAYTNYYKNQAEVTKDLRVYILLSSTDPNIPVDAVPWSSAQILQLYQDPKYGMSTAKTLTYWVNAGLSGSATSEASMILFTHFTEEGLPLTEAQLQMMIGPDSSMDGIISTGVYNVGFTSSNPILTVPALEGQLVSSSPTDSVTFESVFNSVADLTP